MKNLYTFLTAVLITATVFGQVPESFNYQAVLRDATGNIMADASVSIQVSILQGSETGTEVFTETHDVYTNTFGLVNLELGSVNTSGIKAIDWATGPYYIKITVDGTEMGTGQLLSVPYALYAENANYGPDGDIDSTNEFQELNITGNTLSITDGNSVVLPITYPDTLWKKNGDVIYTDYLVGIGTSDPKQELHIKTTYGDTHVRMENKKGAHWDMKVIGEDNSLRFSAKDTNNKYLGDLVIVNQDGNLSIGTEEDWAKLNVGGMVRILPGEMSWGTHVSLDATTLNKGKSYSLASTAGDAMEGPGKFLIRDEDFNSFLVIDSLGNVGIGTTSPDQILELQRRKARIHINDEDGDLRWKAGSSDLGSFITMYDSNNIVKANISTNQNTFFNSTYVGVGTSTPSKKLHILVDSNDLNIPVLIQNLNGTETGGNAVGIGFNNEGGGDWIKAAIAHERTSYYGTGTLHFLLDNTDDDSDVTLSDSKMSITREGDVGIAMSNPQAKLHLNGSFILGTDENIPGFGTSSLLNTDHGILYQAGGTDWAHHFVAYNTGDIARFGNSTGVNEEPDTKVVIDNEGNMGIGTALPSRKMHIQVDSNGLNLPLMLHNLNGTESGGNAIGIGFNNESGGDWIKAAIAHERTSHYGTGTLHFLLDNTNDNSNATLSDSKLSITRDGNVGIGTTEPGAKLQVKDGDVYVETIGSGIILKSPDGSCWRITVDNSGNLSTTAVGCP